MPNYRLTFTAFEPVDYQTDVEAFSPEEAINLFNAAPQDYSWIDTGAGDIQDITNIVVKGEWVDGNLKPISNA